MIPQSFIADLLARVDVVEVVGRFVQLKKAGANYMGLCPFHNEKSPSFTVSPSKQFYHCFGCGENGSALGFLMQYQGMSFPDAVEELARNCGLTVPHDTRLAPEEAARVRVQRVGLTEVLSRAMDFYREQLRGSPRAIDYLKRRGLSGAIAAQFKLGYAPDDWQGLAAPFENYQDEQLVDAGLVIERTDDDTGEVRRYDRFRDRIMFPIRNPKGDVIGFGGRVIDQGEPKYLNSPETPVFNKGNELYGLLEARQSIRERGHVLVTEGYMDVVALAQLGFPNSVATLGTATSGIHVQKLLRQTDHIVYSFDGDAAGRKAAWRALESALPFAADDKRISFLFLPAEHDPDSFVRAEGTAAFDAEIAKALPLSAFLVRELANRNAMDSAEGRSAMLSQATPLLKLLPAGALRLQIMRLLAQSADMNPADVERITGLEAVAPRGGNKNYRPGARTARAATRSKERQVMDALVRDLGQYSAVRDTFLLWREDLEVMPTSVRRSDDAATLLDLVDWMELQMRSGLSPKASDLAAFAQENASIAQLLADNMREEADAVADPDALRAACQELRSTQLGAWANACIAANDLPAYRSLTERARNEGVRLRAVGV